MHIGFAIIWMIRNQSEVHREKEDTEKERERECK
jgi:hypothetical protein